MIRVTNEVSSIRVIAVAAQGIEIHESGADLKTEIAQAVKKAIGPISGEGIKDAVRDMLRTKTFKPTGRNKPASEYLAQAAAEERFPFINNAVDVNNLLSLETGLPVSLLDADTIGESASIRLGGAEERYVFNGAGHEIDLDGLAVVCGSDGTPLGNAIKDSMRGKLKEGTKNVIGFVWAPAALMTDKMLDEQAVAERFEALLKQYCRATQTSAVFV